MTKEDPVKATLSVEGLRCFLGHGRPWLAGAFWLWAAALMYLLLTAKEFIKVSIRDFSTAIVPSAIVAGFVHASIRIFCDEKHPGRSVLALAQMQGDNDGKK